MLHEEGDVYNLLVPSFDAPSRQSLPIVAVFNLIATIVGGGVLSLPLAFEKLGVGLATILMIGAAIVTDQSLYLLCICARLTGASSYGEVGRMAFGPTMETVMSVLLFVFLMFVLVAYQVLLRDIWTPLVQQALILGGGTNNDDDEYDDSSNNNKGLSGNMVLLGILILLSPFVVQHNLHALRYNCFVGFASVSILCLALCHHAFWGVFPTTYDTANGSIRYFTNDIADVLFAFPIIMLSFLSHFNILPIQAALIRPTRQRTRAMVRLAVTGCFVLMYLFGLGGYIYAGTETQGNILLNITTPRHDDFMFVLGRIGVGITIMVATPVMTLPCRENLLEVIDILTGREDQVETTIIGEQTALLREEPIQKDPVFGNPWWHYGSTLGIMLITYLGAAAVPSVAVVWSLCGSSMAFLIAFILPTAFYLQIQRREHIPDRQGWVSFCWILLAVSIVSALACTMQTIAQTFQS